MKTAKEIIGFLEKNGFISSGQQKMMTDPEYLPTIEKFLGGEGYNFNELKTDIEKLNNKVAGLAAGLGVRIN